MDPVKREDTCFVCDIGRLVLNTTTIDIPNFGEVSVTTFICDHCGYRSTDVIPVEARPPARYSCKVDGDPSLSIRIIRSSTGTIRIPEIGVRIDPGTVSEGYITNSEGVLNRVETIIDQVLKEANRALERGEDEPANKEKASRCMALNDRIKAAKEGNDSLTIILEDPLGNSGMVGPSGRVIKSPLGPEDIADLLRTGGAWDPTE